MAVIESGFNFVTSIADAFGVEHAEAVRVLLDVNYVCIEIDVIDVDGSFDPQTGDINRIMKTFEIPSEQVFDFSADLIKKLGLSLDSDVTHINIFATVDDISKVHIERVLHKDEATSICDAIADAFDLKKKGVTIDHSLVKARKIDI